MGEGQLYAYINILCSIGDEVSNLQATFSIFPTR